MGMEKVSGPLALLKAVLEHPEDLMPLVKMKVASKKIELQFPEFSPWGFVYSMLEKVSPSFSLVIEQLGCDLRDAVCVFYLVLRALDVIEGDTIIPVYDKVQMLMGFHEHINDPKWHFSCGKSAYKILMEKFNLVGAAFMELNESYQVAIEDISMRMGAGIAKFISKEIDTVDDYDEYCHYVAGLVGVGLSKLFHASKLEDLAPESVSNSMGLFLQKTHIISCYVEDIKEMTTPYILWPRQIWSKYADKLEDLMYEENAVKAVQCLNEMVTNALVHAEDCLVFMSALKDKSIFGFCVIPQIMAIGTLALCYNNVEVFRGVVKLRHGLAVRISDQIKSMADVYGAFYDFCTQLESKVNMNDPNAVLTLKRVDAIKKACVSSGLLNKRGFYVDERRQVYSSAMILAIALLLACLFGIHLVQ
ncbi:squalene synthase-like [Phalaenopsis equestris]|uniref:squalene synthase-like n=1 Tax=Phalaenopsis equestris TaxID=78828 RepID=UPI0009E5ADD9|nr:squalene synthase-like [Phalaenopsis equestris]